MSELLPCECGKPSRIEVAGDGGVYIRCQDALCWMGPERSTKAAAIEAWNRRAHPSPQPADAGLREATERLRGAVLAEAIEIHRRNMKASHHEDGSRVDAMEEDAKLYAALDRYSESASLSAVGMRESGEALKRSETELLGALYMVKLLKAASHALRSYEHGNSDPTTAKTVADQIDAAFSAPPRQPGPGSREDLKERSDYYAEDEPFSPTLMGEGDEPAPESKETTIDGQCDTCGHLYTDLMMANLHEEDHPGHTIIWNYDTSPEAREPGGGKV